MLSNIVLESSNQTVRRLYLETSELSVDKFMRRSPQKWQDALMAKIPIIVSKYTMAVIQLLLGFLLIAVDLNHVHGQDDDCQFITPKSTNEITTNANLFCEIKDKIVSELCVNKIRPYFEEVAEDKESIEEYLQLCDNLDTPRCISMLFKLRQFCYNMDRAAQLSKVLPNLYMHIFPDSYPGPPGKFDLHYFQWKKYGGNAYDGVQIEKCVGHISQVIKEINASYKPWLESQGGEADCDCNEIVGLTGFTSTPTNPRTSAAVYNDFCSSQTGHDNTERKHVWNIKQLDAISQDQYGSYEDKMRFIKSATKVGEAGWKETDKKECHFGFIEQLITQFKTEPDSNYEKSAELISVAIKAEIPCGRFFFFVTSLKEKFNFIPVQCLTDIFNHVFTFNSNKKHFLEKCKHTIFLNIIEQFIILFHRKFSKVECSKLLPDLMRFQDDIENMNFGEERVFHSIRKAETNNIDYDNLIDFIKNNEN